MAPGKSPSLHRGQPGAAAGGRDPGRGDGLEGTLSHGNCRSIGECAEGSAYESSGRGSLLAYSQGSQCLGDVMMSLGGRFQPRVAPEKLVPMGNTQLLSMKNPRRKRWDSEPSCVCVCACVCVF